MHALEAKPKQKKHLKKRETKERRKEKEKQNVPVVFGPGGNNIGVFFVVS